MGHLRQLQYHSLSLSTSQCRYHYRGQLPPTSYCISYILYPRYPDTQNDTIITQPLLSYFPYQATTFQIIPEANTQRKSRLVGRPPGPSAQPARVTRGRIGESDKQNRNVLRLRSPSTKSERESPRETEERRTHIAHTTHPVTKQESPDRHRLL